MCAGVRTISARGTATGGGDDYQLRSVHQTISPIAFWASACEAAGSLCERCPAVCPETGENLAPKACQASDHRTSLIFAVRMLPWRYSIGFGDGGPMRSKLVDAFHSSRDCG